MKLKSVCWKNFKSYSNAMTTINFDNTSSLNLIVGSNGTGKSSIAECITYLLYGKIDNIKAAEIPNRINKNFYGKIELDCDGHEVVIERGLAPSLFVVTIDGNKVDTAGKLNVQATLEDNYYKIPYSVFRSVLMLSINEFKSLVDLNPSDKRNIIDKIFGFSQYNMLYKLVKEEIKVIDNKISTNTGAINTSSININNYIRQIEEIKKNVCSKEMLEELEGKVRDAEALKQKCNESLDKLNKVKTDLNNSFIEKNGDIRTIRVRIQEIEKKVNLINMGKCPTCGTSLETEEFLSEKGKLLAEKEECNQSIDTIVSFQNELKNKMLAIGKRETQIRETDNQNRLMDIKAELKSKQSIKESNIDPLMKLKNELDLQLEELQNERAKLDEERGDLEVMAKMFGEEGGIKKYTATKYVPTLNQIIADMMEFMGVPYNVVFDNNFNTSIIANGSPITYASLSTGEKKRVDFATVISFIKLMKLKFGELNLLFLDELFSNIDVNGVADMMSLLRDLCSDMNLNVYLIHHAQLENVLFDHVLETSKPDGFSQINFL